jgi:hypothetical protein
VDFLTILKTPFRPRKGFEALAGKMAWVWVPCIVFLLVALVARIAVETPRQIEFQDAANQAQAEKFQAEMQGPGVVTDESGPADGTDTSGDAAPAKEDVAPPDSEIIVPDGSDVPGTDTTVAWISAFVFQTIGLLAGVLFTALLFFVAGKVSAATANYRAYLSMTALAFVPFGLRDLVQAAYMTLANAYTRLPGLSVFAAPADPWLPGGMLFGVLALVDVWTFWAVILLYAGLRHGIGLDKKRSLIAWGVFIGAVLVSRIAVGGVIQTLSGGF